VMGVQLVYSAEEIVRKYGHVLEDVLQKCILGEYKRQIGIIDAICGCLGLEYDWAHGAGFVDWVEGLRDDLKICSRFADRLLEHYRLAKESDAEWQAVFYGVEKIRRGG